MKLQEIFKKRVESRLVDLARENIDDLINFIEESVCAMIDENPTLKYYDLYDVPDYIGDECSYEVFKKIRDILISEQNIYLHRYQEAGKLCFTVYMSSSDELSYTR